MSDDEQFASFWNAVFPNHWEDFTFHVLDHYLHPDQNYLDIGAWIGPTALYAAHKAKQTFCIEPDPVAYRELLQNITLNPELEPKLTAINRALSYKSGTMKLYKRTRFGDSSSSLIPTLSEEFHTVTVCSLKELLADYQITDVSLIKIDIEGGEYLLVPAMRKYLKKYTPPLYLSLHPEFLKSYLRKNCKSSSEEAINRDYEKSVKRLVKSLDMYKYIYDSSSQIIAKPQLSNKLFSHDKPIELLFTSEKFKEN